jgi:recombination protein RecR
LKQVNYPEPIKNMIAELKRMPAIGPRSAERIALWMVQSKDARPNEIAKAVQIVSEQIRTCARCGFFSTAELCEICNDQTRDSLTLCVVEQPTDILPIERTGVFRGRYHALGGRISPLDHLGPESLRIDALVERVKAEKPSEVILALSADVEGEATANYVAELLGILPVKITRIAQGLPAGGGLDSADELTLSRALTGRRQVSE